MSEQITSQTMEVRKDSWGDTRIVAEQVNTELAENEVLLKVDRFALTANNISYAGAGDMLGYWGFFPAEEGWGRIPAMAWGDVLASNHPEIEAGERVWGFFPMGTHLRILAGKVREDQFVDVSSHRAEYAPAYAQFTRAAALPIYEEAREDQDSLLRGLFMTSWLAEDFMWDNDYFGAEAFLITSASSKTSIALGFAVTQRGEKRSIGLTSSSNKAFCESLGCYDEVVTYDELTSLDASMPVVMVDMAGSASVISTLHHHFADNMKYSCRVGATHYTEMGAVDDLPGAQPEFFFAPSQVQKRSAELGAGELMMKLGVAYVAFRQFADSWLTVVQGRGPEVVDATYQQVLAGGVSPTEGQILSMWPE